MDPGHFGFGDNGLNNLEKYKLLVSDKALEIYEKYGFEIKDLIVVDDPKYLKFLLDEWIEKEFAIDQGESLKEVLELSPSLINGYFLLHCDS